MIQFQEKRLNPRRTGLLLARIEDLSLGACIETDRRFTAGQNIMLKYFDPFSREPSELKGEIVWSSDDAIGVKFNYFLYSPF